MKLKRLAAMFAGIIVMLLGLLWILQGLGILRVCPILCFMDCECVTGGSAFWVATGAVASIIGVIIVGVIARRAEKS